MLAGTLHPCLLPLSYSHMDHSTTSPVLKSFKLMRSNIKCIVFLLLSTEYMSKRIIANCFNYVQTFFEIGCKENLLKLTAKETQFSETQDNNLCCAVNSAADTIID